MTWIVSLRRWRRQSIGDRYPRHYFLYDRGLLGNLLLILLGLQGPWTPAFSSSVSKQHAPEDLLAICLPNVCHVFGVQPQLVFHMLVPLCRTFVAWSSFCIPNYFLGQQNNESVFPRKTKKSKNMAFLFPISHQSKPANFEIFVLNMCTFGKRQRLAVYI